MGRNTGRALRRRLRGGDGGHGDRRRPRHAALVPRAGPRLRARRGGPRRRRHRDRPVLHGPAVLRLGRAGPARRDVHRLPQPGPVQRHQDVPGRRRPGRPGHRSRADPRTGRGMAGVGRPRAGRRARHHRLPRDAGGLRGAPALAGRPHRRPPPEGRGRRGQRHGRPHRAHGLRRPAPDPRPDVLRTGRHLPEPRGQPARPGQPRGPPEAGPGRGRRPRHRLRRRRRPLLRRRRERRPGLPVRRHRPGRRPRTRAQRRGGHRHPQPDHLAHRPGGRPRARRHPGPHPRRPLLHQGGDGPHRRDLRWRALRALLLQGLLERRHGHAGRPARAGRPRRPGGHAVRAGRPVRPLRGLRRDQLHRRRPGRPHRRDPRRLRGPRRRHPGRPRRAHRLRRRLVVQRPPLQHGAAAPLERRGEGRGHHGRDPRRRPGDHQGLKPRSAPQRLR
ncbi:Phosphomannomutase [Streptomyces misionensis JCM 4497]